MCDREALFRLMAAQAAQQQLLHCFGLDPAAWPAHPAFWAPVRGAGDAPVESFDHALSKLFAAGEEHRKANAPSKSKSSTGEKSKKIADTSCVPSSSSSPSTDVPDKKEDTRRRPLADAKLARLPLEHGWRRQTCIRSITANGLRGDVIYWTPCGKKISSYAEVIRYLQRSDLSKNLTRDNFTFSCKIIIGEFITVGMSDKGEKQLKMITEEEMVAELKKLSDEKIAKMAEEKVKKEKPLKEKKEALRLQREALREKRRLEKEKEKEEKRKIVEEKEQENDEGGGTDERAKRQPVDDLLLEEMRPLPEFSRIENLELDGTAFADVLMVHEFLSNFSRVLEIKEVPSLSSLCAGLNGSSSECPLVSTVLHVLLTHALRLPVARKVCPIIGRPLSSFSLQRENRSELLRLFLLSCDQPGISLASSLANASFEQLSASTKASILGCLVNEVVCCGNIVKEIDTNLEELARLKGDRWMREGKIRALRGVQTRKLKEARNRGEGEDRPSSRASDHSDSASRGGSPSRVFVHKTLTPGIGQCEVLTPEEENMSSEEIDVRIATLSTESDQLRVQMQHVHSKIRTYPFGEDRFHRQYWQLPGLPILLESIESSAPNNPACDLSLCGSDPPSVSLSSFIDPDVVGCVESLVDDVVSGRIEGKKKNKHVVRKMGNYEKRGWWSIENRDVDGWKTSLHGRGFRERALHRLILKEWWAKKAHFGTICLDAPSKRKLDPSTNEEETIQSIGDSLSSLKYRIRMAELFAKDPESLSTDLSFSSLRDHLLSIGSSIDPRYFAEDFRIRLMDEEKEDDEAEEEGKREEKRDEGKEEVVPAIVQWKSLVDGSTSSSQLSLLSALLDLLISWDLSPIWHCAHCRKEDNTYPEADRVKCDKCATSAHNECVQQETFVCRRCAAEQTEEKVLTDAKEEVVDENGGEVCRRVAKRKAVVDPPSFVVPSSMVTDLCRSILDEMETQRAVGPFLFPVDTVAVPEYKAVIKQPIDLSTIRDRVDNDWYESADDFQSDIDLMFSNCRLFNEDRSDIGQAGISLHKFFNKRWRQLKYNLSKRVKRMRTN